MTETPIARRAACADPSLPTRAGSAVALVAAMAFVMAAVDRRRRLGRSATAS